MRAEGTAAADVPADQDQGAIEIEENRFETAFQADCRRANLKRGASTSPAPPRTLIDGSLLGPSRQPQSRAGDTHRPALIRCASGRRIDAIIPFPIATSAAR